MSKSSGRIWPYAIGISILLVVGACVGTVIVTNTMPVENSDTYMMGYHEADAKANELIEAKIAFDKKYKLNFLSDSLHVEGSTLSYELKDKDGDVVNNADIITVVTRPNKHKYDQELSNPNIKDGVYSFENVKLPLEGRWDVMAKITIGENQRFYNVKMDTRSRGAYEY